MAVKHIIGKGIGFSPVNYLVTKGFGDYDTDVTTKSGVERLRATEAQADANELDRRRRYVLEQRGIAEGIIAQSLRAEAEFKAKAKTAAKFADTSKVSAAVKAQAPERIIGEAEALAASLRLTEQSEKIESAIALMLEQGRKLAELTGQRQELEARIEAEQQAIEMMLRDDEDALMAILMVV